MIYRLLIVVFVANVCLASSRDKFALTKDKEIKEEKKSPSIPYNFEYNSRDENGSTQFRKESSDVNGKVQGRYGYKDLYGIERIVEYTADENGYRAEIKTNEPGTENKNPAGVLFYSQPMNTAILHRETATNTKEEQLRTDQNSQATPSGDMGQSSPVLLSQPQLSSGQQYFFMGEQPQVATASASAMASKEEGIQQYSFFGANDDKKTESMVFPSASSGPDEKQSSDVPKYQPAAFQFVAPQQFQYVGGNTQGQFLVSPLNQYYQYAPQNTYASVQRSHISAQPLAYSSVPQTVQPLVYQYAPQPLAYQNNIASPAHAGQAYASYGLVNLQGQQFSSLAKTQ